MKVDDKMKKKKVKIRVIWVLAVFSVLFMIACADSDNDGGWINDNWMMESDQSWFTENDHGTHDKMVEWWYFTGDTKTAENQRFGFEFTIFKTLIGGAETYMGHLAISDVENTIHYFIEEIVPGSGITDVGTLEIPCGALDLTYDTEEGFSLIGTKGPVGIDMAVTPTLSPILHGEDGTVTMPDGNLSYYYTFANAETSGTLTVNEETYSVTGRTWMDHQWGDFRAATSSWDWFSIRFDDGGALMLFNFDDTGTAHATYRDANGIITKTTNCEINEIPSSRNFQDESASYSLGWELVIDDLNMDIVVDPLFDAQSLYGNIIKSYWEGLCSVTGTIDGVSTTGSAYVELTGYDIVE